MNEYYNYRKSKFYFDYFMKDFIFKSKLFGDQTVREEIGIERVSRYEKECLDFLKAYGLSVSNAPFYLGGFSAYILLKDIFKVN